MTDIALALIKPNPFRDFDLHPIDDAQVEKLTASIDADGFWASVVARQVENGYEIAFGHHRVAAAKLLKRTAIPVEVRELSDWQMVRMLASENATQRGSTAAACIDAVAAISRMLAYHLLRGGKEPGVVKNLTTLGVDYAVCRGLLERGGGIGRSCIAAFAPKDAFSRAQIDMALGILKDSGRMATIVAEAQARAAHELHSALARWPTTRRRRRCVPSASPAGGWRSACGPGGRRSARASCMRSTATGRGGVPNMPASGGCPANAARVY